MNKTILVFGSGFNPPTLAHEAIIASCLGLTQFDEIWLMPSGDRFDKIMGASDKDRLRMAEILKVEKFADDRRIRVTDFELKLPRPTETNHTTKALAEVYPDTTFWWALGTDSFFSMPSWSHGVELQKSLNMIIFDRGDADKIHQDNVMHVRLPSSFLVVSSSRVRSSIAKGESTQNLISEPIKKYIAKHNLYA